MPTHQSICEDYQSVITDKSIAKISSMSVTIVCFGMHTRAMKRQVCEQKCAALQVTWVQKSTHFSSFGCCLHSSVNI